MRGMPPAVDAPPSPPSLGAAVASAAMDNVPPPPPGQGGVALDPDANSPLVALGVPPPPIVGGATFFLPPVVLRVLPLQGSSQVPKIDL